MLTWVGNVGRILLGLVALRLVTEAIPESDLGAYWILTSVAALLANFADLGLGLGVARHLPLAADATHGRRLMSTVLGLRALALVALCVVLAAAKPWVLHLFSAETIASRYAYIYAFVVVSSLSELYTNFLQGLNRFRAIAIYALLSSLARLVLIVALVRGLGMQVEGLFLAEVLSILTAALLSAWACGLGLPQRLDRDVAGHQLRFGFPLYINTLLAYAATRLNTLILASSSGPVAVSYFSVATRVPDQLSMVLRSYIQVYLPNMSRFLAAGDTERASRLLAASLRLMSFCFAMLTLLLGFFRHELLAVLAPPSYQVAAAAVPLLAGALAFSALGSIFGNTLVALGDSRTPLLVNLWTSGFSIAVNLVCIHFWGLMGAAWASFVFNVLGWAVVDVVVSRRLSPGGRSYAGILVVLGGVFLAGLRATPFLRVLLIAGAALGSLLLSRSLRHDLQSVWELRRHGSRS